VLQNLAKDIQVFFIYIAAKGIKNLAKLHFPKMFCPSYLEVAKPVSLHLHGNKGKEMVATVEVGDGEALIIREVGHTME
jgi:hypothetical protein